MLALARAEKIADEDLDAASALLGAHARDLQGVRAAQRLAQKIDLVRREDHRREARNRFQTARALLADLGADGDQAGDLSPWSVEHAQVAARARELLSDRTMELLQGEDRASAAALRGTADRFLERAAYFGRLMSLIDSADVAGARAFVETSFANTPEKPGDPGWRQDIHEALRRSTEQGIQARFRACVAGEGARELSQRGLARAVVTDAAMPMPDLWGVTFSRMGGVERSIRAGEVIQLQSRGELAFIRVIAFGDGAPRLRRVAILRTPQPAWLFSGDTDTENVVGVGIFGAMLAVSTTDFSVRAWRPPVPFHAGAIRFPEYAPPWFVQTTIMCPELRYAWNLETLVDAPAFIRVVDTATLRVVHEERVDPTGLTFEVLLGDPDADIAVLGQSTSPIDLRRADGALVPGGRFGLQPARMSVTACPGGGVFAMARERVEDPYGAVRLVPGAPAPVPVPIDNLPGEHVLGAAADLAGGRVFLLHDAGGQRFLTALRAGQDGFSRAFQVRVPARSMLALDVESHRPRLLVVTRRTFDVLPLEGEPPVLPDLPDLPLAVVPRVRQFGLRCHEIEGPRPEAVQRWVNETRGLPRSEIGRITRRLFRQNDPDTLCDFARALDIHQHVVEVVEIDKLIHLGHPGHALARLRAARPFASVGQWDHVRDLLVGHSDAGLDSAAARHFGHLLGLALLDAGRHDEALPVLLRALEHEGPCQLESLIGLASPDANDDIPERQSMRELVRIVAAADRRLAARDALGAIGVLDDAVVWEAREVQSLARLARAFLAAGDELPPDLQIRKAFALATYWEGHGDRSCNRREVLLKDRWRAESLDAIWPEAVAWLEDFPTRSALDPPPEGGSG